MLEKRISNLNGIALGQSMRRHHKLFLHTTPPMRLQLTYGLGKLGPSSSCALHFPNTPQRSANCYSSKVTSQLKVPDAIYHTTPLKTTRGASKNYIHLTIKTSYTFPKK
jgi:hypothetical protein